MADIELMRHLAALSNIRFTEAELAEMAVEMADIIALMAQVKNVEKLPPYRQETVQYEELRSDISVQRESAAQEFIVLKILG